MKRAVSDVDNFDAEMSASTLAKALIWGPRSTAKFITPGEWAEVVNLSISVEQGYIDGSDLSKSIHLFKKFLAKMCPYLTLNRYDNNHSTIRFRYDVQFHSSPFELVSKRDLPLKMSPLATQILEHCNYSSPQITSKNEPPTSHKKQRAGKTFHMLTDAKYRRKIARAFTEHCWSFEDFKFDDKESRIDILNVVLNDIIGLQNIKKEEECRPKDELIEDSVVIILKDIERARSTLVRHEMDHAMKVYDAYRELSFEKDSAVDKTLMIMGTAEMPTITSKGLKQALGRRSSARESCALTGGLHKTTFAAQKASFEAEVLAQVVLCKSELFNLREGEDDTVLHNVLFSRAILRDAAQQVAASQRWLDIDHIQKLKFSNGWITDFLKTHELRRKRLCAEEKPRLSDEIIREFMKEPQDKLMLGSFPKSRVWNLDETSLRYLLGPLYIYMPRRQNRGQLIGDEKTRVTLVVNINVTGIFAPLMFIIKCCITVRDTGL